VKVKQQVVEYKNAVICRSKTKGFRERLRRPAWWSQLHWQEGTEDDEGAAQEYGCEGHGSGSTEGTVSDGTE